MNNLIPESIKKTGLWSLFENNQDLIIDVVNKVIDVWKENSNNKKITPTDQEAIEKIIETAKKNGVKNIKVGNVSDNSYGIFYRSENPRDKLGLGMSFDNNYQIDITFKDNP